MRSCYVTSILRDDDGNYFAEIHTQLEKTLGFESGSEVYFSWLEKKTKVRGKIESRPELIVTSISPDAWDDLYDLEFHLGDSPGSLASGAEVLWKNGINILIAQSRTTMREREAEWTMSANFKRFDGDPEKFKDVLKDEIEENPDKNRKEYLRNRILRIYWCAKMMPGTMRRLRRQISRLKEEDKRLTRENTFFQGEYERLTAENIYLLMENETLRQKLEESRETKKKKSYPAKPHKTGTQKKPGRKPEFKGTSRKSHCSDVCF